MRCDLALLALMMALIGLLGCGAGVDPDLRLTLVVTAESDLNTYTEGGREGPHPLDLYVFKVDDPDAFLANEPSALRVVHAEPLGGRWVGRWTIAPGTTERRLDLGKAREERWTHLGIFAAYGGPAGAPDAQKQVLEIDGDGEMMLLLGSRQILSFVQD